MSRLSLTLAFAVLIGFPGAARAGNDCAALLKAQHLFDTPFSATVIMSGLPGCGPQDCAKTVRDGVAGQSVPPPQKPPGPTVGHMRWTGTKLFVKIDGLSDWVGFALPVNKAMDAAGGAMPMPKMMPGAVCRQQHDATLDGEPVTDFTFKGDGGGMKVDGEAWVAKSNGLPVKFVIRSDKALTIVMLLDYKTPVVAPPNAQMMTPPPKDVPPADAPPPDKPSGDKPGN